MSMPNSIDTPAEALSLREAAKRLGVSKSAVWGICNRREIRHRRVGSLIKIEQADLDAYVASHTVEVAP